MDENDLKQDQKDEEIVPEVNPTQSDDDIEYTDDDLALTVNKLKEKIKLLEKEKLEYLTGWQRTKADYINSKKDDEKNKKDFLKFANESLVTELLPSLDAFDMAMAQKEAWEKVDKNWRAGIEYIYNQLIQTLERAGVKQENPLNQIVDPTKHHPIGTVPTEDSSLKGKVAEVMQKGYTMHGKEIRPASVKVYE